MVVRVPFHRWVHVEHRSLQPVHGGFYCLLPIQGRRVIAVVARYRHPGQLECKAFSLFVREYAELLGLGDNLIWAVRDDLVKWLDALVHNSFMRHSTPGLRASFEGIGRTTWILIKHGCKAWPIEVVDGMMQNGWREFRTAHALTTNYRLILTCERRWIFNAIILDQNDLEVSYDWTMLLNEHWRELHGLQVQMGNRTWSISLNNGDLNDAMFNQLLDALQLQLFDYVFITMLPNLTVRIIVLHATTDRERIYDWL
ncbi:hypothetical protein RHMOL_Rhmol08G0244000 [Rhododendron molle]|uniref:Uncharacterized protein n=1 Tax=Rhododendron molle TaxID=49168 RepID=A0ACC0MSZ4_RHOML|nr:hypothetical protein RHMOL_Rhmol08G0244000 [Rhododendron molle]